MTQLSVNLNKIALLRNARNIGIPSVIEAAKIVINAGAYGVTVHPRPDERHIRYSDVYELSELLNTDFDNIEFNMEGNPFTGRYRELVKEVKPDQATLVPDEPGANTSDHGWDLNRQNRERLLPVVEQLTALGIRVSLFMDPDPDQIKLAKELGANRIELYTEPYARAFRTSQNLEETLQRYASAAAFAHKTGLGVNAGHDLNLNNLGKFLSSVPGVLEVSIGHALIADALTIGLGNTVRKYLEALAQN